MLWSKETVSAADTVFELRTQDSQLTSATELTAAAKKLVANDIPCPEFFQEIIPIDGENAVLFSGYLIL